MQVLLQKITAIHQHYRKDRLNGSMYVYLSASSSLWPAAVLTEDSHHFPQSWRITTNKSTSLRSEEEPAHTARGRSSCSPLCNLLTRLSPCRIHLSTHIKRVKSLFREDSVLRYKELLASARIWSRSEAVPSLTPSTCSPVGCKSKFKRKFISVFCCRKQPCCSLSLILLTFVSFLSPRLQRFAGDADPAAGLQLFLHRLVGRLGDE